MFFFLLLGAIEVIAIIIVYRLIEIYIVGTIRRNRYKITNETNVLLTGAAMGAGKFLAMNFAKKNNCNIIIYDIREDLMGQVIEDIQKVGAKGYFYKCDVSDEQELERTVQATIEKFLKIDILINNVGIANLKLFTDVSFDEVQKAFSVNFLAPVSIIKKILPVMIERNEGHIVNVSSVASLMPSVKMTDYCASKAALSGFHNALRLELKQQKKKINTTLVCPYAVNTGVLQGLETKLKSLFPILDENYVADEIYNAILEQREEVFIPQSWKQGALFLRALPTAVIDYLSIHFLGQVAQKLTGKHSKKKD